MCTKYRQAQCFPAFVCSNGLVSSAYAFGQTMNPLQKSILRETAPKPQQPKTTRQTTNTQPSRGTHDSASGCHALNLTHLFLAMLAVAGGKQFCIYLSLVRCCRNSPCDTLGSTAATICAIIRRNDAKPFASKMLDSCLRSMSLGCKRGMEWQRPDLVHRPRVLKPTLCSIQMLPCRLSSR